MDRVARAVADALGERGLAVVPGFLPSGETARLERRGFALLRRGALRPAAIGKGPTRAHEPSIRGDLVRWIDPASASRGEVRLLARIERLRLALNERLLLGAFDLELHWALYPPGAHYARHRDRPRGSDARLVSLVAYLNGGWTREDGGALRVHLEDGRTRDVSPCGGTLVVFASERFEHEVLPARRARLAITGWLRRRPRS